MSTKVGNNTRQFTDSAFCWQACSKMFCGVTFEFEFSDLIGTSYVKKHHVGDIKSIFLAYFQGLKDMEQLCILAGKMLKNKILEDALV